MSKLHPEAFVEWTATATGTTAATATKAAIANVRHYITFIIVSTSGTVTGSGTITVTLGAASFTINLPTSSSAIFAVTFTKALRCDTNFAANIALAGATGSAACAVTFGGYSVRE